MSAAAAGRDGRGPAQRDQHESAFAAVLGDLVQRVPGALAAVLVDHDGETVDYCGGIAPYDLKVAAARWRIVLDDLHRQPALVGATLVVVRARSRSFLISTLPERYALVVLFRRGGGFSGWRRALPSCVRALSAEAGWPRTKTQWYPVQVEVDDQRRPVAVRAEARNSSPVVILGSVVGSAARGEKAWRVRFDTGLEATLVRESSGNWYTDDLDQTLQEPPAPRRKETR